MADTLKFTGDLMTTPAVGAPSGRASVRVPFDEVLSLTGALPVATYELTSDSPQAVAFGGLADVAFVMVRLVSGGRVRVRLTSAEGSAQAVPVDEFLILKSRRSPFTAMDLTRDAGVASVVEVFLGKMS